MDFIVDGLATGRMVRILSVVDVYTRECLALEADTSLRLRARDAGAGAADRRAWPARKCALGQRAGVYLAAHAGLVRGLEDRAGAYPARPPDAKRPRRELPRTAARRVPQRQLVPDLERCTRAPWRSWRQEYNWERPHSSLGYQTPEQFRQSAGYANMEGPTAPPTFTQPRRRLRSLSKANPKPRISSHHWLRKTGSVLISFFPLPVDRRIYDCPYQSDSTCYCQNTYDYANHG